MKKHKLTHQQGFSLVEIIVMIAIIGILSAIAVPTYTKVMTASKKSVAQNLVETLNNATKEFGHAQYELVSTADTGTTDEIHILNTLQWKDPDIELGVAGPFMRTDWVPSSSSSSDDYRAVWSGSFWILAEPGEAGAGLKVDFESRDLGTQVNLGTNFTPFPPAVYQSDPVEVALNDGNTLADSIGELFDTGVDVAPSDSTSPVADIEEQVGQAIAEQLSNEVDLSGASGEVVVEVDEAAANSDYAEQLADALAAALLGQSGDDATVTQQTSDDGESVTITATIPTETNEQITATATITAQDVTTANQSITELSALLESAETAASEAETSGSVDVAIAANAAVEAAEDAAVAANAAADGTGDIATAEAAAEVAEAAAEAAQAAANQVTDPDATAAAQAAADAAQAAADAANEVVEVVSQTEDDDDSNSLMDDILNAFTNAF